MPTNFQVVVPNKLYRSGRISPSELPMLTGHLWNVKKIVSLDAAAGNAIAPYIPEGVEHIMLPIDIGGNGSLQARKLAQNIKSGLLDANNGAVLVHCMAGQDRTGLAIALFRAIKQKWDCKAIFEEGQYKGYGNGISEQLKKGFDSEICRYCYGDYCKNFIVNEEGEAEPDTQSIDDIATVMRNQFSHQQGWPSAGAIPPAFEPQQSFSIPMDPTSNMWGGNHVNVYAKLKIRKKLLKRLINLLQNELQNNNEEEQNDVVDVGIIDNYNGISNTQFNPPSGSPGAPNAAGPVESGSLIQL